MIRRFYYWLLSPAGLEDISGVKGAYAERLRRAGVKSPAQLFARVYQASKLQQLAQDTEMDLELLRSVVARSRRPWFQNYKLTGLLAIFFGLTGTAGTVITFDSWRQAKAFGAEEQHRLQEIEERNSDAGTPVWTFSLVMEPEGLPTRLFSDYEADKSKLAKQFYRKNVQPAPQQYKQLWDLISKRQRKYFFEDWTSAISTEGEWYPGMLMLELSDSPPIQVGFTPCPPWFRKLATIPSLFTLHDDSDMRRPRACEPGIYLNTATNVAIKPRNPSWIQVGQSLANNLPFGMTSPIIGEAAGDSETGGDKVAFTIDFGPEEIKQLSAAVGPINIASLRGKPALVFWIPATRDHTVKSGNSVASMPYIPPEVVEHYIASLPMMFNIMVVVNGGRRFRTFYSFGRQRTFSDDTGDGVDFQYTLRGQKEAPLTSIRPDDLLP